MNSNQLTNEPFHKVVVKLLRKREEEGLRHSRKWLSEQVNVSDPFIGYLLNRPRQHKPTREILIKVAAAFGINPLYFREYRTLEAKRMIEENQRLADLITTESKILVAVPKRILEEKDEKKREKLLRKAYEEAEQAFKR